MYCRTAVSIPLTGTDSREHMPENHGFFFEKPYLCYFFKKDFYRANITLFEYFAFTAKNNSGKNEYGHRRSR